MKTSLIAAAAENDVIGRQGTLLPWRLPADLAHFKQLTVGHPIIMGRKTYETIGRPLPGRLNLIISQNPQFSAAGCTVVGSLAEGLESARATGTDEAFVIGGGMVFATAEPLASRIYLTRVHAAPPGDTFFRINEADWREISREDHLADDQNDYAYSFINLVRT